MMMDKILNYILIYLSFMGCVTRGQFHKDIICPTPDGNIPISEEICGQFSACEFEEGNCYMKDPEISSYKITQNEFQTKHSSKYYLEKIQEDITMFGSDIHQLSFDVIEHSDYHLQLKISDINESRYEVPFGLNIQTSDRVDPLYEISIPETDNTFGIKIDRKSTKSTIFETIGSLTFEDQFLQLSWKLPSKYLYGLGENPHQTFLHDFEQRTTVPIFSRDQFLTPGDINEYGHQPYYQVIEDDAGNTHSLLFYSSNAMEYSTFPLSNDETAITFRTIGGMIDIHILMGPQPEEVNQQYAKLVGMPAFPPYWALGFQLSRWGYKTTDEVRAIREKMKDYGVPQEVQTFDIDYMENRRDFTYDKEHFADLPEFIEELHNDNVKTVLILDPAIAIDFENYAPAMRGKEQDVFIKWPHNLVPENQTSSADDYIVGRVWPDNYTVFPDFLNPKTHLWWSNEIQLMHSELNFDGIWIDMNEPSNFGTNLHIDEPSWDNLQCPHNQLDSPPYPTKASYMIDNPSKRLSDKTICMSSLQNNGNETYSHYDVHSLYGYSQTIATAKAMEEVFPHKRHLILSRSNFPGTGKYAAHWTGDNTATWQFLQMSIIGLLEYNMFAIPMVGADICGFNLHPSEELCARWMQLGAFYPFSRNHNGNGPLSQDPTVWPKVAEISQKVLLFRYRYLPYLYTLFHNAHTAGNSVIRPLWSLDASDITARDIHDQFLWGSDVMVSPVLEKDMRNREVYFPQGYWYDLEQGTLVSKGKETLLIDAPLEDIPVFIRGGSILPFQIPALTLDESRKNEFGLTIALNDDNSSKGELFWDDGISKHQDANYYKGSFSYENGTIKIQLVKGLIFMVEEACVMDNINIYGLALKPEKITLNNNILSENKWTYDEKKKALVLTELRIHMWEDATIQIE